MRRKFFIILPLLIAAVVLTGGVEAPFALAQTITAEETFGGTEPTSFAESAGLGTGNIVLVISRVIRVIIGFLGVVAVGFVLYGGFLWMSSKGEVAKVDKARKVLVNAFIGLAIVLSSFAIASFIISKLTEAIGGTIEGGGGGGGDYDDILDPATTFVLQSANTECAYALRNFQLQFSFSQNVSSTTVTEQTGITIETAGGEAVVGTFAVSGKRVTFTPTATCTADDGSAVACFDANTTYNADVDSSIVESASGRTLQCSDTYPCSFSFTTGEGFDIAEPTVAIEDPDDGDPAYNDPAVVDIQAYGEDDSGVSSVDFYLDGDLIDSAGLDESLEGDLALENYFYGEWDTTGYVTNEVYGVSAEGYDCAGNSDVSETNDVVLRWWTCNNEELDDGDPYFEDDVDCGGDSDSEYYCGECNGAACTDDLECASGECDETTGTCVASVEIEEVSPTDGAVDNLITILGNGFGSTAGRVIFLGDPDDDADDVTVTGYAACDDTWGDDQIVIQVDDATVDGPIEVVTSDSLADRTDDENGPVISDFDVNDTVRPGLCQLDPSEGEGGDAITVRGNNFGSSPGSSTFYFDVYEPTSYPSWETTADAFSAVLPLMDSGTYDTQLFVGDGDAREGSNVLEFTVSTTSDSDDPPIITSVDTGVKRCSDDGSICGDAGDCATTGATCDEDENAGPIGQYVTIYGTNFGSSDGTVRFRNQTFDYSGLADTDFPDYCDTDFWADEMIVVKVPETYSLSEDAGGDPYDMQSSAHDLWVVRGDDGVSSDVVDFDVIDGLAGPSICSLEPDNGPPGTDVTVVGEAFGTDQGSVTFYDRLSVTPGNWGDTEITGTTSEPLQVPDDAENGPVFVTDDGGYDSNSVNFEVGYCGVDFSCEAGDECCENGSCQADGSCEEDQVPVHYAYYFSTGDLPDAPEVIVECSDDYISPSPWVFWDGGSEVCVNATITASFSTSMDTTTFTSSTIAVESCSDDTCSSTTSVTMDPVGGPEDGDVTLTMFSWDPDGDMAPNTRYRVTVLGGDDGVQSADGAGMADDVSWEFVTAATDEHCTVGDVYLSPAEYTATEPYNASDADTDVPYVSLPIADEYQCVVLACEGYLWDFSSSDTSLAGLFQPDSYDCAAYAYPYADTTAGPVIITSELTDYSVSDTGELTINFTDPEIVDYWPNCDVACRNAEIGFETNVDMTDDFSSYDSNGDRMVRLFECEDPACAEDELTGVDDADTDVAVSWNSDTYILTIDVSESLQADTAYRVVVSQELESTSGTPFSEWGGGSMAWNGYLSWTFTTKEEECVIDRIELDPAAATLEIVGDRQQFSAVPYSAPDECSASGQRLDAGDFTWEAWTAEDDVDRVASADVAALLPDGGGDILVSDDLPNYCSSSCVNVGSTAPIAVCGDNATSCSSDSNCSSYGADAVCNDLGQCVQPGEDCDDGNTTDGDGCSSECLTEGVTACADPSDSLCCGNGTREDREECDDGANEDDDGCSSTCLNEGASEIGTDCGDGSVAQSDAIGGEDCDWGSANDAYNCSSDCLNMGSIDEDDVYAVCGDGGEGYGEDCDDGNTDDGDGCSSICQNEGSSAGGSTCGDSTVGTGEDCDDGNTDDGDGCSSDCLSEGSDYTYSGTAWSVCSDGGSLGVGEQCEATTAGTAVATFGIAEITTDAPEEVLANYTANQVNEATSIITATDQESGITGVGTLTIACSCTSDFTCGDTVTYGCGNANCCYERPSILDYTPNQDETDVCQNTAVWVEFDQAMDEASFEQATTVADEITGEPVDVTEPTLYLELVAVGDGAGGETAIDDSNYLTLCPSTYEVEVSYDDSDATLFQKTWRWVVRGVHRVFGRGAYAATVSCRIPVSFEQEATSSGSRVRLVYDEALEAYGVYDLVIVGDSTNPSDGEVAGVASEFGVGLLSGDTVEFTVGDEVCALDLVEVEDQGKTVSSSFEDPSPGTFTEADEIHTLTAATYTLDGAEQEEIQELAGIYDWSFAWSSTESDSDATQNIITVAEDATDESEAAATASGLEGDETAVAIATITSDTVSTTSTANDQVSGEEDLIALLCENPWPNPDTQEFPFSDTRAAAADFGLSSPYTQFSFYYCRDLDASMCTGGSNDGASCSTDSDCGGGSCVSLLPILDVVEAPVSPIAELRTELLFLVDGTSDALGARVFSNEDYLSADEWYAEQDFTGSPTATILDGYEGVLDGNTYYIAAGNQITTKLYPNVYVFSVNEDAGAAATDIYSQILDTWSFHANRDIITDYNVCKDGSDYVTDPATGDMISCTWDGDCDEVTYSDGSTETFASGACDAEKAKVTRDMRRLTDARQVQDMLETYGETYGHCSVTTDEACEVDSDCPGSETCVADVPTLESGSFLRSFTTSTWPSWSAVLGNALGEALPTDPVNEFFDCPSGADETYCWDSVEGEFTCEEGSHAYVYRAVGIEDYFFYFQLEYDDASWAYDIDLSSTDNATIFAEYARRNTPTGFYINGQICDGTAIGTSGLCGDGTIGGSELCELGDTTTIECATTSGKITVTCDSDCGTSAASTTDAYQTEAEALAAGAECAAYECGNGVVDTGEDCDDGDLNGTYGYCGESCTLSDAFYCGDGSLAGGEDCDCGDDSSTLSSGTWSSANCSSPNGQYSTDYGSSCAFDCSFPGPTCGDGEENGNEECDGSYESTSGLLCGAADNYEPCDTDDDCDATSCGDGGDACDIATVCEGGTRDGYGCGTFIARSACVTGGGTCSAFTYQLERSRTCDDDVGSSPSCTWNGWTDCLGGDQVCGNGTVEGDEECDDGNDDSTDDCTEKCTLNVCGDGYVYSGKETCDDGDDNGVACRPEYDDTCTYCTNACRYTVVSGAYCGDGEAQDDEFCDASDVPKYCFDGDSNPDSRVLSTETACDADSDCTSLGAGYTCETVGVCDGGSAYVSSTETYDFNGAPCVSESSTQSERCGTTSSTYDTTQGSCVALACAADCESACPFSYDTSSILIQTELAGAAKATEADLYSYASGDSPDTAVLYLPACTVGTEVTADIDMTDVIPPDVAVVFVTDASNSMAWCVDGTDRCDGTETQRIDYVRESMVDGIDELFDTYDKRGGVMTIGLLRYSGPDDDTEVETTDDGYTLDADLSSSTYQTDLVAALDSYDEDQCYQWTPTYLGMEKGIEMLDASGADIQIMILLSDGNITHGDGWVECDEDDCVKEIRTGLIDTNDDILFFSAAIVSDSDTDGQGWIAHLSSDDCGTDWDNPDDCAATDGVEYAYQASTAEEVASMYETIISVITGVSFQFTTDFAGETTITSGSVNDGSDVILPFPTGFDCDDTSEWTIPVRISFLGEGTVNISNIQLEYCPAD